MTGEKEDKQDSVGKIGNGLDTAVQGEELCGSDRCCEEANRQLWIGFSEIIQGFVDRAKKGDPAALKMLFEMGDRARRKEPISKEEIETLGEMLMREFHRLDKDENGSEGETKAQERAA